MTQEAEAAVEAVALAIDKCAFHAPRRRMTRAEYFQHLARAAIAAYEATLRPAIEAEIVERQRSMLALHFDQILAELAGREGATNTDPALTDTNSGGSHG